MAQLSDAQQQSLCDMYRDGASFRTLETAFGLDSEQIIEVLLQNGVVRQNEGESRDAFVDRIRQDVAHESAT